MSGSERSLAGASVTAHNVQARRTVVAKIIGHESDREPTAFELCATLQPSQTPTLSPDVAHTRGGTFFFSL
jgi:hypothetical protein